MISLLLILVQDPSAEFKEVRISHVKREGKAGVELSVDFNVKGQKDKKISLIAYYYDKDQNPLKDTNKNFHTSDGFVCASTEKTPPYDSTVFTKVAVFIPYEELHVAEGEQDLRFKLQVYAPSAGKFIGASGFYVLKFRWEKGPSAAVKQVWIDHAELDFDAGVRISFDFRIDKCKDRECVAAVYYFDKDEKPLKDTNKRFYTPSGNVVAFEKFKPAYDAAEYTKFHVFIPYEELHIPKGAADLRFHVKIFVVGTGWEEIGASPMYKLQFTWKDPAAATVQGVWIEHGVREYEPGVWLKVDFLIGHREGKPCTIVAYLHDENQKDLDDENGEFRTVNGKVATLEDFTPEFDRQKYTKYPLFLPYNELHRAQGEHKLTFRIRIYARDGGWDEIGMSNMYVLPVTLKHAERGAVTGTKHDLNKKEGGKNGIEVITDFGTSAMKGRKGRVVLEFYYDLSRLSVLNKNGRKEDGIMSYSREFTPDLDRASYRGERWWIPYSEFPLEAGRNVFYYKVWLQSRTDDDKWHTLDATRASQFYVTSGKLDLKEVWAIDSIPVLLDWTPDADEEKLLLETLTEFNRRLYDATDGQVRVKEFVLGRLTGQEGKHGGSFLIWKDTSPKNTACPWPENYKKGTVNAWAWLGNPDRPGNMNLGFDRLQKRGASYYASTLAHEFFHAAFGLTDEYDERKEEGHKDAFIETFCAENEMLRKEWGTCMMGAGSPIRRELCRPRTHVSSSWSGRWVQDDCYTRLAKALNGSKLSRERGFPQVIVPGTPVDGPTNPPTPGFRK